MVARKKATPKKKVVKKTSSALIKLKDQVNRLLEMKSQLELALNSKRETIIILNKIIETRNTALDEVEAELKIVTEHLVNSQSDNRELYREKSVLIRALDRIV